jgi:hypothetical protein
VYVNGLSGMRQALPSFILHRPFYRYIVWENSPEVVTIRSLLRQTADIADVPCGTTQVMAPTWVYRAAFITVG